MTGNGNVRSDLSWIEGGGLRRWLTMLRWVASGGAWQHCRAPSCIDDAVAQSAGNTSTSWNCWTGSAAEGRSVAAGHQRRGGVMVVWCGSGSSRGVQAATPTQCCQAAGFFVEKRPMRRRKKAATTTSKQARRQRRPTPGRRTDVRAAAGSPLICFSRGEIHTPPPVLGCSPAAAEAAGGPPLRPGQRAAGLSSSSRRSHVRQQKSAQKCYCHSSIVHRPLLPSYPRRTKYINLQIGPHLLMTGSSASE